MRFALLAVAALAMASPAFAQYGPPPPPPPETAAQSGSAQQAPAQATPQAEVIRAVACLVGQNAEHATALLATAPYSNAERDQATRLLREAGRCLTPRVRVAASAIVARGAAAETLYERDFPQAQAAATPPVPLTPIFRPAEATVRNAASSAPAFALAECSAARRPDLVRAYLATEAGTPAETAALNEVNRNAFAPCVVPGSQLSVDQFGIRAMLAEALYRWSLAQRGPVAPTPAPSTATPGA